MMFKQILMIGLGLLLGASSSVFAQGAVTFVGVVAVPSCTPILNVTGFVNDSIRTLTTHEGASEQSFILSMQGCDSRQEVLESIATVHFYSLDDETKGKWIVSSNGQDQTLSAKGTRPIPIGVRKSERSSNPEYRIRLNGGVKVDGHAIYVVTFY